MRFFKKSIFSLIILICLNGCASSKLTNHEIQHCKDVSFNENHSEGYDPMPAFNQCLKSKKAQKKKQDNKNAALGFFTFMFEVFVMIEEKS